MFHLQRNMDLDGPITRGLNRFCSICRLNFGIFRIFELNYKNSSLRSRNCRLIYCQAEYLLEFVENENYHKTQQITLKCQKIASALKSQRTMAYIGLGSFVWVNLRTFIIILLIRCHRVTNLLR